jgi:predicted transcriptional regulator
MEAPTCQTDAVFRALASGVRRQILDLVRQNPGCCVNDLCQHFNISRVAILKQLNVLVHAQLLISKKKGRKRELFFNAAPIQMIYDRWTTEYAAFWASQAVDLKYRVEAKQKARNGRSANKQSPEQPVPQQATAGRQKKGSRSKSEKRSAGDRSSLQAKVKK